MPLSDVPLQIALVTGCIITQITFERFDTVVDAHVTLEQRFPAK